MNSHPLPITAVIVLYQRTPAESEAFLSLHRILDAEPLWAARFHLLLYDNSSEPSQMSADSSNAYPVVYLHDKSNGGLSAAFNYALQQAREQRSAWLLLLDQDTTVTREYVHELLDAMASYQDHELVGAIVPLLEFGGRIFSPEETFSYHMRHQFPYIRYYRGTADMAGLQTRALNAYNSGAAIRVSALEKIGGFPVEFKIDYLDFAFFHLLHQHGYRLYILRSQLHQELSHDDLNQVSLERHTSVLRSQALFAARYGTLLDRMLFRLWLLRMSRHYRNCCSDPRVWKGMVKQALLPFRG